MSAGDNVQTVLLRFRIINLADTEGDESLELTEPFEQPETTIRDDVIDRDKVTLVKCQASD